MSRGGGRAPTTASLAASLAILAVLGTHTVNSYDSPWHVRTGEVILAQGVPETDPFSYTAPRDAPWINHEWGADVLMALLARAGGDAALSVATAAAVLAAGLLALERGSLAAPFALLVAAQVAAPRMQARPHLLTTILVLAFVRLAEHVRATGSRRAMVALVALELLWANLHGGFFLGPVVLGITLAGAAVDGLRGLPVGRGVRELAAAAVMTAVAPVANPWGFGLLTHAATQLTSVSSTGFVGEWSRPFDGQSFDQPTLYLGLLLALLGAAAVAAIARSARPPAGQLLLLLLAAALGLSARRNADLAAFLGCLLLQRIAAPVLAGAGRRARLVLLALPLVLAPLFAWDVLSLRYVTRNGFPGRPGLGTTPLLFPEGAAAWVERHAPAGNMLNTYNAGGYLIARLPGAPVFIDGRNLLYGTAHLDAYNRALVDPRALEDVLSRFQIGYVVVDAGPGSQSLLSMLGRHPGFALTFLDGAGAVLVSRSLNPELARQSLPEPSGELPPFPEPAAPAWRWPGLLGIPGPRLGAYGEAHGRGVMLLSLGRFDAARRELRAAAAASPQAGEAWFNLGVAELQAGSPVEAERALRAALARDPRAFETRRALAESLRMQGRSEESVALYRELAEADPGRDDVRLHLAHALRAGGDVAGAVREMRAVLGRQPGRVDVASDLGTLLAEQGDVAAAELELRGVLARAPGYAPAAANLGALMLLRKDFDQAQALAEQALASEPGMPQAVKVMAYCHLARRELDGALAAFHAYVRAEPRDLMAATDMASVLADLGRVEDARKVLEAVLRASPGLSPARERLARLEGAPASGRVP